MEFPEVVVDTVHPELGYIKGIGTLVHEDMKRGESYIVMHDTGWAIRLPRNTGPSNIPHWDRLSSSRQEALLKRLENASDPENIIAEDMFRFLGIRYLLEAEARNSSSKEELLETIRAERPNLRLSSEEEELIISYLERKGHVYQR